MDKPLISKLICPQCKGKLLSDTNGLRCQHCKIIYPLIGNIPCFIDPNTFNEEEHQYKINKVLSEKRIQLNSHIRSQISKILLEKGFSENHIGVDLGVGSGEDINFAHIYSKVTRDLIGVDVAMGALKEFPKSFPDALGILADAERLPLEDSSCDFVTASGIIHHMIGQKESLDNVFCEVYRICKRGGIFIFNEPNLMYPASLAVHPLNRLLQKIKANARGRVPYERPVHYFELKTTLCKAGFVNLGVEAASYAHRFMPKWLIEKIVAKENIINKFSSLKYFGAWIVVYGQKPPS